MSADGAVEPVAAVYGRSLAELYLAQVRRHADRPAIAGIDGRLSYAELGSRAERFARGLRHLGLPEGAVVAVAGGRGRDACVAMLGAACAGLTYMPLDPSLPADRQRRMETHDPRCEHHKLTDLHPTRIGDGFKDRYFRSTRQQATDQTAVGCRVRHSRLI